MFTIQIPPELFKIEHTIDVSQWAPAIWSGVEGMKLTITKVDLETRTITLELIK